MPSTGARGRWHPRRPARRFFADALVSPVLTAHPTEVRRKSTLNREMEIARLLTERERVGSRPRSRRRATKRCGAPCSRCGRRASCAGPSSPSSTRSRTGSPTTAPPSCASCRGSTPISRTRSRRSTRPGSARGAVLPAHGQLDRRRPRRQPLRHRRRAAQAVPPAERPGVELLPRGAARAGRRALAQQPGRQRVRAAAGLGRPLAGPIRTARTSPTAAPSPASTRAWPRRRVLGLPEVHAIPWATPRPMRDAGELRAELDVLDLSLKSTARPSWRAGGCAAAACGRRVRLSPGQPRPAPERRRPRAHGRRAVRGRSPRHRLPPSRGGASPCCWRSSRRRGRWPRRSWPIPRRPSGRSSRTAAEMRRLYGPAAVPNCVISKADGVGRPGGGAAAQGGRACCGRGEACST